MNPHELRSEESADEATPGSSSAAKGNEELKESAHEPQQAVAIQPLPIPPILLEGDQAPATAEIQPHKFATGVVPPPTAAGPETKELPEAYGTGQVWLAPQDPHCLYARWDLTSDQTIQYASGSANPVLVVKVYPQSRPEEPVAELHVSPEKRHSFIHVEAAGEKYVAEVGYYTAGRWKQVSVSEPVATPVERVAEEAPIEFATHELEPSCATVPKHPPPGPQQVTAGPPKVTRPQPQPVRAALPSFLAQAETISGVPQSKLDNLWLEKARLAGGTGSEFEVEPGNLPSAHGSQWTASHDQALAELIGWTLARHSMPGSAEVTELLKGRAESSSSGQHQVPIHQGFWFSVNAELIIYGATEPNAKVAVSGRPVELRPDGSFSFRVALPDGQHVFSAAAYSAEGEIRRVELEVKRATQSDNETAAVPPQGGG